MLRADHLPIDGITLGEGLDVFFRPTTPTTPLISPTSDDSSLHTFPTDGSPNLSMSSHHSIPLPDNTDNKKGQHACCNSPMLKTLLEPTPRSRSTDNLEKFSPLVGRRSQGDTPLTTSPLARRNTTEGPSDYNYDDNPTDTKKRTTLPIVGCTPLGVSRLLRDSSVTSTDETVESENNNVGASIKLRSAAFDQRSPTEQQNYSPDLKTPVKVNSGFTELAKQSQSIIATKINVGNKYGGTVVIPPATASKPRPWSMTADSKSGEFNNLPCDGSSPNTSTGNTPDSGHPLEESTESGVSGPASLPLTLSPSSTSSSLSSVEKRSVRELAASLTKERPKNNSIASDRKPTSKLIMKSR